MNPIDLYISEAPPEQQEPLSETEKQHLIHLEESLWKENTRFDTAYMENILHPEFFEFGRSGRTYERSMSIYVPRESINAVFPLRNLQIHLINDDTALIVYQSQVQYEEFEIGNRSSLWVRVGTEWKLRFHQGTPTTL